MHSLAEFLKSLLMSLFRIIKDNQFVHFIILVMYSKIGMLHHINCEANHHSRI